MDRGYSPWGCKEADTNEATEHTHIIQTYLSNSLSMAYIGNNFKNKHLNPNWENFCILKLILEIVTCPV